VDNSRASVPAEASITMLEQGILHGGLATIREAGSFLSLSRAMLYRLMDSGELPFVTIGRTRRIPKLALVALAARSLRGGSNRGSL
jgi:excisionase family DNA binding protein